MSNSTFEWSWDNSPIMLPLKFENREWNAIHIAFFLAEYSGSTVNIMHVNSVTDSSEENEKFLNKLDHIATDLKVKYNVQCIGEQSVEPSITEIAHTIISESEKLGSQVIVMAAHRESFFREFFGRTSDKVTPKSNRNVILVETPRPIINLPKAPSKILIPVLRDEYDPSPYIVAAALSSTATVANSELVVAKIMCLPPTIPLDAVNTSKSLRNLEQNFSYNVVSSIKNLGRPFTSKVLPVRDIGKDVNNYATEIKADIIILSSPKPSGFHKFLPREEYDIVGNATCIVLVVFPKAQ